MAVVQIQMSKPNQAQGFALFNLGFRPFFLGASIFAVVSIVWWMLIYSGHSFVQINTITNSQWHAHEMLYGYGVAVVAGFLLTAVKNWTGLQTVNGKPLMGLFMLWCLARVLFLFGTSLLLWAAVADLLFGLILILAISKPIASAKQWPQLAVVAKVVLLWIGNVVFYLGYYGLLQDGMLYAINGAVLLFISLILMIGRRVIPFFIERGVASNGAGNKVNLKQHKWLDLSILVLFLALFVNEVFLHAPRLTSWLALALFALNSYRLRNWYAHGIWQVPLLWSLYLSLLIINLGFLCYGLQTQLAIPAILTLHLFTIGGVGLMTMGMMARVALGHTGRDIRKSSPWLTFAFAAIAVSAIFRIFVPMLAMQHYASWVLISALFWIIGFTIFVVIYAPILFKPRIDGTFG
ncbi:MAG: NnrS family protein [Methylotenera sp.]|nr:NnrS family protein [Methylotenera sp.]MDP2282383.1 NnrS family protein [Methylotenera sp.]MDP3061487.1 NnrS family protein [Methylotenera sp.]